MFFPFEFISCSPFQAIYNRQGWFFVSQASYQLHLKSSDFKNHLIILISDLKVVTSAKPATANLIFLERGETIKITSYCNIVKKVFRTIQNKRHQILTTVVCLLYDNACSHNTQATQELLASFGRDVLSHSSLSLNLTFCDYHLLIKLKGHLSGKHFSDEVKYFLRLILLIFVYDLITPIFSTVITQTQIA